MAAPILPPRRREDWLTPDGDFTLRALRFFESLTDGTNLNADEIEDLDQTDPGPLFALLTQADDTASELGFVDDPQFVDTESIESELGFSDDVLIPVDNSKREVTTTAIDYTTIGAEIVQCTAALTITLNASPDDQELVTISITNGNVKVSGNGKNIDGDTDVKIVFANIQPPGVIDCLYLADLDEWIIK